MKQFLKKYGRYIFIFILVFLIYEVFDYGIAYGDPIANYGFSYAITRGQIPYLDFNTISTPLYAFYGSIGLFIFNNYITFIVEHAILVTVMFYFLYHLYGKKSYLVLMILVCCNFYGLLATYNFMCFTMMVILMYLEERHKEKDYLIGFFIGLSILSKHTVGIFFVIPTIIKYFRNSKKILRRAVGCLIPCCVFIIYLLINDAFFKFIDLCILGLFDFSSKNGNLFTLWFFISVFCIILSIFLVAKRPKDIKNWYLVFTVSFTIPLFDYCHFPLYGASIVMMLIPYFKFNDKYALIVSWLFILEMCIGSSIYMLKFEPVFQKGLKHFEYTLNSNYSYNMSKKVSNFINSYENPILLSYFTMQYDIINDNNLDYYDVMLYGNFGYKGDQRIINEFKRMENQIFIISVEAYEKENVNTQFAKSIADYVIENCEKIDSKYGFDVYYQK